MAAARAYRNRHEAGQKLATLLGNLDRGSAVVLALPRGGVPVAQAVAKALDAPLGILAVRKVGAPGRPELAMGAVASGGVELVNDDVVRGCGVSPDRLAAALARAREELREREGRWGGHALPVEADATVVLVDDGLATGATMRAAVAAARRLGAKRVVVAVPVGAAGAVADLQREADDVVCPVVPEPFFAVGMHYADFSQVSDAEVRAALAAAGDG